MPGVESRLGVDFAKEFTNSDLARQNLAMIDELAVPVEGSTPLQFDTVHSQARIS